MESRHHISLLMLFALLQPLAPIVLRAQVDRTALTGIVTDQQGNRIPQSTVRVTEGATGFERETQTTSQGSYELPGLPPGVYRVVFSKAGFADLIAKNVEQLVGQTRTLDVRLDVARGKDETTVTEPGADRQSGRDGRHRGRIAAGRRFADQRQKLGDADSARSGRDR